MDKIHQKDISPWVDEYLPRLRRYFSSRVNSADVDDLVQEVFTQLHWHVHQSDIEIESPRNYIFAVAKNLLISYGRYQKSRCRTLHESLSQDLEIPDVITPERTVIGMQDCRCVLKAILGLPPRAGTAFKFHRFEGMTYQDIAERMGISKESVKELIQRALIKVRRALEEVP
ncbi:RNA polymerase sigma factor [Microbulbifer variabilis]|uniref:RNA polymerase sigma factor n=1 Tax=Microbulbifer variabilis TaxID=266805 RepID=UPI001CFD53F5|nr:RNA polymerase sigma factor [Microbulbifer variabilis]